MSTVVELPSPSAKSVSNEAANLTRPLTVALAGNPNAGKTSLFNALTGLRQKVANYPGVTVERKEGLWSLSSDKPPARLIDLPGLYSLDATSIDEQIARGVLLGRAVSLDSPDVIIVVVDATNLERNLYLATQLIEAGRPVVIALTMIDLVERSKTEIDVRKMGSALGVPVVAVVAKQRRGLSELAQVVMKAVASPAPNAGWQLSEETERELAELAPGFYESRDEAMRALYSEDFPVEAEKREAIKLVRSRLTQINPQWWQEPMVARYHWIESVVAETVCRNCVDGKTSITDRIDALVTHRFFGPLILAVVMLLVFQTIFSWANLPMNLIDKGFGSLGDMVRNALPAGLLTDLLVDGVIAGVGGVLVFLPQILLLFFFISLLEDSGYMARAAFLMDRLMRAVGLHGKAFMPLLSSFACAIPGIMATRTIENPKDRFATIMIAPFMSCSARLPVYTLMIAAFFSGRKVFGILSMGVLIILAMYLLGIIVAIVVAWILKHTILKAPPPPLVLELPPYRVPNLINIAHTMRTRAGLFVKRAGTVILAISILLWALVTFPRTDAKKNANQQQVAAQRSSDTGSQANERSGQADSSEQASASETSEQIQNSFAGRLGRFIEPAIAPLGFDWKMGIGLISSFAARETLVSTLSIVYNVGPDGDENSPSLIDAVRNAKRPDGSPAWTPLVALSMMVFFVLACQCMSTVAIVRRETNSWRWPLFMVSYMLVLAYIGSFITYQGGRLLGFS